MIEVTNFNHSGTGSLRACVQASEPRTCVFRVGGTITLNSTLQIVNPFITIAGQTAPGGGILLDGRALDYPNAMVVQIGTHDVVWRYTRIRKGASTYCTNNPNPGCGQGLVVAGGDDMSNIVLDHNSVQWNTDEGITVYTSASSATIRDITISWNLHAWGLDPHSTCMLLGTRSAIADEIVDIDLHHNMCANNHNRHPHIEVKRGRWVNNIIYNWQGNSTTAFAGGAHWDAIGNHYKRGPGTNRHPFQISDQYSWPSGTPSLYLSGNTGPQLANPGGDQWLLVNLIPGFQASEIGPAPRSYQRSTPLASSTFPITPDPVGNLEDVLLPLVGASRRLDCDGRWLMNRDAVDTQVINNYKTGTGTVIGHESDAGGFPTLATGVRCADADHDGMPDQWEIASGLNPNDPADRNADLNGNGYTNLEEFLSGQTIGGGGPVPAPTANSSADPTSISAGESPTLSRSSTDAASCTETNFSTGGAVAGAERVPPAADTTYTLDCAGPGGGASDSATVTAPALAGFPVSLTGSAPEEASVTIEVSRPADADQATLSLIVNDADFADEGALFINGNGPLALFGDQVGADGATVTTTFTTPASWWENGTNTLRFRHTETAGYRVGSADVSFAENDGSLPTACAATVLNVGSASSDRGFAWLLRGDYGFPADNSSNPTRSTLRLFEGGTNSARPTVCIAISVTSARAASATGAMSTAPARRCALPAPTTPIRAATAVPTRCAPAGSTTTAARR